MNEIVFVKERGEDWRELNRLCDRADVTLRRLSQSELDEFIRLYRAVSNDLSNARTNSGNLELLNFLNQLVGRAYTILYRPVRGSFKDGVVWLIVTFAQTVRRRALFVYLSILTFLVGAVFGYATLSAVPDTREILVPEGMKPVFEQWQQGTHSEKSADSSLVATGMYASNNPRVALQTAGIAAATFGFGTFYVLFQNGSLIGTLIHEVQQTGKVGFLLSSIFPHGATELQGIFIVGAAGYLIGWSLIAPGQRSRADSFKIAMKDGFTLMMGGIIMMYIAAPFEGYFSFNPMVPQYAKVIAGFLVVAAWGIFYAGVGRTEEEQLERLESKARRNRSLAPRTVKET